MPPVKPSDLAVLVEGQTGYRAPTARLAGPSGVLYSPPNLDGSTKRCANCSLWAETDQQCLIHGDLAVSGDMVCGYHVYGEPQVFGSSIIRPPGVDPALSGLISAPNGTSCGQCRFVEGPAKAPRCAAVADPETGQPGARVHALGCCARWEPQ